MTQYDTNILEEGVLDENHIYQIVVSAKKAPGLVEGVHALAVIKDSTKSILELPSGVFWRLVSIAVAYAEGHAEKPGKMRIAWNGVGVASRDHAHVHIILPMGSDKLEPIVAR